MFPHDPAPKGEVEGEREIKEEIGVVVEVLRGGKRNEEFWVGYIG